jgi:hypothetical protein
MINNTKRGLFDQEHASKKYYETRVLERMEREDLVM